MRDHRPRFHLTAPTGWLNDPNGLVDRDDLYHVFYQHNPAAPAWARIHWGHAVSEDLVRWRHLPPALAPSPGGPDAGGCWSGSFVDDAGTPTLVYSGFEARSAIGARTVCLARGDDRLVSWRKDGRNPVLAGPPADVDAIAFRDPYVWRDEEGWSMILGAGLAGVGPVVLRYRSDDLLDWHYAGVVCSGETGVAWECPQLFPLGAGHVLLASVWDDTRHPAPQHAEVLAGTYRDGRFEPESRTRFDHGADCYAPATMLDRHGRRLAWAWSWEARDVAAQHEQGWAGVLTLPRVLTRGDDGTLRIAPAAELASLRGEGEIRRQQRLQAGESLRLATLGECLELDLRADLARASTISLDLRASPGGEEHTTIRFTPATGRLELDRSRASLDPRAAGGVHGGTLALGQGEPLELRVFLDRSIVEVYANERFTVTERIYPTREDSIGLALTAEGGEATIEHLHVWQLDLSL